MRKLRCKVIVIFLKSHGDRIKPVALLSTPVFFYSFVAA